VTFTRDVERGRMPCRKLANVLGMLPATTWCTEHWRRRSGVCGFGLEVAQTQPCGLRDKGGELESEAQDMPRMLLMSRIRRGKKVKIRSIRRHDIHDAILELKEAQAGGRQVQAQEQGSSAAVQVGTGSRPALRPAATRTP
jgi:hypothetical protein